MSNYALSANDHRRPPSTFPGQTPQARLFACLVLRWGCLDSYPLVARRPSAKRAEAKTRDLQENAEVEMGKESLGGGSQTREGGRLRKMRTRRRWLIARAGSKKVLVVNVLVVLGDMIQFHAYADGRSRSWQLEPSRREALAWPYHRTARVCRGRPVRGAKPLS